MELAKAQHTQAFLELLFLLLEMEIAAQQKPMLTSVNAHSLTHHLQAL
jgi:hypothetical protein